MSKRSGAPPYFESAFVRNTITQAHRSISDPRNDFSILQPLERLISLAAKYL